MKQPVERRLAAIVAADMAGYSRLMGLDEAGTAQALREHRAAADPLIAQHAGRIVSASAAAQSPDRRSTIPQAQSPGCFILLSPRPEVTPEPQPEPMPPRAGQRSRVTG
jgi:hypothetical protein